jgi:hypothetical protein
MPARRSETAVPACGPDDLVVVVRWERDGTGLRGQMIAENVSGQACQLASKPDVTPLQPDGSPLPTRTIISLEWTSPGYVILQPGQRAAHPQPTAAADSSSRRRRLERSDARPWLPQRWYDALPRLST